MWQTSQTSHKMVAHMVHMAMQPLPVSNLNSSTPFTEVTVLTLQSTGQAMQPCQPWQNPFAKHVLQWHG